MNIFLKKSSCVFLPASFIPASFCVCLSLLLLSRYDTANEYATRKRSKKRPKRKSETECNTSRTNETQKERRKMKRQRKITKKKCNRLGKRRKPEQTNDEKQKRWKKKKGKKKKRKKKEKHFKTVSKLLIRILFSLPIHIRGVYFYKEVCSFLHWSSSLCLIMFPLYICICITAIQQSHCCFSFGSVGMY